MSLFVTTIHKALHPSLQENCCPYDRQQQHTALLPKQQLSHTPHTRLDRMKEEQKALWSLSTTHGRENFQSSWAELLWWWLNTILSIWYSLVQATYYKLLLGAAFRLMSYGSTKRFWSSVDYSTKTMALHKLFICTYVCKTLSYMKTSDWIYWLWTEKIKPHWGLYVLLACSTNQNKRIS
jgi:hypothetical protein